MPTHKPLVLDHVELCVDEILQRLGKQIRVGLPLGLGKPPELINALYGRAKADPSIELTILTALSLEKPVGGTAIEAAFLKPFVDRVWGDCPDLLYAVDATQGKLPANVKVQEFFFKPGSRMNNLAAPAGSTGANASDGYSANFASSFFNDSEGVDGTNGAPAQKPGAYRSPG